jgi:hypothetical protein
VQTQSRWTPIALLLFLGLSAISAIASPQSAASEPGGYRCSNRTLNGSYGFLLDGTDLRAGYPIRGVVMQTYDGKGGITQIDHVVYNGGPPAAEWAPGFGTYVVNPDCTGVAVLHTLLQTLQWHFVVVDNGKQIKQVVDANAVTAVGNKVN